MSFFGKIKSAVMGNPVTRDYEVGKQVASAGPGLMWKVHQATKKSTRQAASVFIFSKQTPDFERLHKKQRELILEMLRQGPTHLVRLKHPRLLTVDHPLEESSNCLAFATESVTIGLANILGNYDNLPSPLPLPIKEYEVHPIEIQYGLFNLSEALQFLHSGVRLMHGNITPEVVVLTGGGTWKLMGLNFSCYSQYQSESTTKFQFQEWDSRRPHNTNPSLDFLAPEYILSKSCNEKSDVYSFGMLCYAVYNGGRPLCSSLNNVLSFKHNVETISRVTESGLGEVPHGLRSLVRQMLAVEPSVRPDAMEISKHAFFEEVGVATLRYLDTMFEKGDMERSQYFKKNLALVVNKLPKRIVLQRVIPALREEFRNNKMVPFVLPIVLLVAEDCTVQEYSDVIMPVLIPALRIQNPIQVPLILLQKMDLLLKKTPPEAVRQHILPTIITSLETSNGQLQELCITLIPSFADKVDYSSMKHSIVPRLTALMVTAESVSLRVKCLVAVAKMLDSVDKHIVQDHILPLLQQIPSREPAVLMAILGVTVT
jgi:SCY1-like protein 2